MPSRQDQLHSHQFTVQRVVAALVMRETDPVQSPFRKIAGATMVGVLLAALSLGAAAAYGLIAPGGSGRWKTQNAVVVEKGSGALFVYRDGKLNPVLNYASALLLVGSARPRTVSVSSASLDGVPRGATYGIVGAPALLPARKRLSGAAWTICTSRSGQDQPRSTLFAAGAGVGNPAGRELAAGDAPEALLVATPDGTRHAIIGGRRHLVRDPEVVLPGLVWTAPPIQVAPAFVAALPVGTDLARVAPRIDGFGTPVARPVGGRVGQVYVVKRSGGEDFFVARQQGLAALTPLQAQILLADPWMAAKVGMSAPVELSLGEFTPLGVNVPQFAYGEGDGALPAVPPSLVAPGTGAVCARVSGHDGAVRVLRGVSLSGNSRPVSAGAGGAGGGAQAGAVLVDQILVRPGAGVLVAAVASASATPSAVSLVTDLGVRYAVASDEVIGMLGYGGLPPLRLPSEVVSLMPAGPALDPLAARTPIA